MAAAATLTVVVGVMPAFMLGATAIMVRQELDFGRGALGVAIGAFFGALAAASFPAGHFSERVGPRPALLIALGGSAAATTAIALFTTSWAFLVGWMILGGAAAGLALPAASLALVRGIGDRQGVMFGVSQSAPPTASLIAGIAVPAVALTLGWRWAFALGVALVPLVAVLVPSSRHFPPVLDTSTEPLGGGARGRPGLPRGFFLLSVASGLGSAAAIAMGSFLVESAVHSGHSPGTGGIVLAVGSLVGITSRLFVGWRADRRAGGHLSVVALMLGIATLGYLALAIAQPIVVLAMGTGVAYGFGYGWPGLLFFGITRIHKHAPAAAIGAVNAGAAAGAAAGPALFGLVVSRASFTAAWLLAALMTLLGSLLVVVVRPRLDAQGLRRSPGRPPFPRP